MQRVRPYLGISEEGHEFRSWRGGMYPRCGRRCVREPLCGALLLLVMSQHVSYFCTEEITTLGYIQQQVPPDEILRGVVVYNAAVVAPRRACFMIRMCDGMRRARFAKHVRRTLQEQLRQTESCSSKQNSSLSRLLSYPAPPANGGGGGTRQYRLLFLRSGPK